MSLATKYRPTTFQECLSQTSIIRILEKQVSTGSFVNAYLFTGPSGTGKTTLAKIFSNGINQNKGNPIEIDAASNNGVDNIRSLIEEAKVRALDAEYKIFIIDECHMITTAGWNAFLKCLEECPKYTIFIFCTTDPQKIPATVINRCMRFNLTKVPLDDIKSRLIYICEQEGFTNYKESCDFIAKRSLGGVRNAIADLEKVSNYSNEISLDNTLTCLGDFSYDSFFNLTNALVDGDDSLIINTIEKYFTSGKDLKLFVEQYLNFLLDLTKYCIFSDLKMLKIPTYSEEDVKKIKYTTGIENNKEYFVSLVNKVLNLKNMIKSDSNNKDTIEVFLLALSRGM